MSFYYEDAKHLLERANRFVTEAPEYIDKRDFATVKFCAYHTFFFSMEAMLQGRGEVTDRHSETLERFRQRYLDTGMFYSGDYPLMELALKLHNQEAYADENLCSDKQAAEMMHRADLFYHRVCERVERNRKMAEDETVEKELALVQKTMALADDFEALYDTMDDDRILGNADVELYSAAKNSLFRMRGFEIDGILETYARCCMRLIRKEKWLIDPAEPEALREVLAVCRELSREDPETWARDTADLCEMLADGLLGKEAFNLYKEALELYDYLYRLTGDDWDRSCIENLKFKIGTVCD